MDYANVYTPFRLLGEGLKVCAIKSNVCHKICIKNLKNMPQICVKMLKMLKMLYV